MPTAIPTTHKITVILLQKYYHIVTIDIRVVNRAYEVELIISASTAEYTNDLLNVIL